MRCCASMQAIPLILEGDFMKAISRWIVQTTFCVALLSLAGPRAQAQSYVSGTASYSAPGLSSTSPIVPMVTADFNGDGIADVVILGTISSGQALSIFRGRPDGSLGPSHFVLPHPPTCSDFELALAEPQPTHNFVFLIRQFTRHAVFHREHIPAASMRPCACRSL